MSSEAPKEGYGFSKSYPDQRQLHQMPEGSGERLIVPNTKIPQSSEDPNKKNIISRREVLKGAIALTGAAFLYPPTIRRLEASISNMGSIESSKEALTASEAFTNLAVRNPMTTVVDIPFFDSESDSQGNLTKIRVLGNHKISAGSTDGWHSLSSVNSGGVFTRYADEVGSVSTKNSPSTLHVVENDGKIGKVLISYEGGIKAMTFREGGVGAAEVEELEIPGVIRSKVAYPERNLVVYSTMRVTTSQEELLVVDTKTNQIKKIPVLIDGATIDPTIIKGKDGNIYCSALSASRNPYGYLKIAFNPDNQTITGIRRHADVRSDNFYLDQSGSEEKALLYDRNRFVLRIYNETTNKLDKSYRVDGILNHVNGVIKDTSSITDIISSEGRIYAGFFVNLNVNDAAPFLVSWPDNIDPNERPELVTYINMADGLVLPEWWAGTFLGSLRLVKRDGKQMVLMRLSYKGLVAVEAEADGSLKKEAPKLMLAEGVLRAEVTPEPTRTSTPTATASPITPTPTNTPVPPEATPTPTATHTPTKSPTPIEQLKKIFMPVIQKFNSLTGW